MGVKFPNHPVEAYGFTPEQMGVFNQLAASFPGVESRHIAQAVFAKKTVPKATEVLKNMQKMFQDIEWHKASVEDLKQFDLAIPLGFVPLPHQVRDSYGSAVICMDFGKWHPKAATDTNALFRAFLMVHEEAQSQDVNVCKHGVAVVADCGSFGWANFDMEFEKMVIGMAKAYPARQGNSYHMNDGPILRTVLKLITAIMPAKMVEKIVMLKEAEDIKKYVHVDGLPREFGGNLNYNYAQWRASIDHAIRAKTV